MITLDNKDNSLNYITKARNGKILIPSVSFDELDEKYILNPEKRTYARYNSLMRFFLYLKLLKYDGSDTIILKYIEGIKNNELDKIEILNKIGNNNRVLDLINEKFNFDYTNHSFNDEDKLKGFINNWKNVLSDNNLRDYISIIHLLSEKAKVSEKIVKGVINMLYGSFNIIKKAELSDDLVGVDIWMINKKTGIKKSIQVKNIPSSINISGKNIFINNTRIDLHDYNKSLDKFLPFDYLGFYSEKDQKVCMINSTVIDFIDVNRKDRYIKLKISDWGIERFPKVIKFLDVPKRFLPKDTSKIFYK